MSELISLLRNATVKRFVPFWKAPAATIARWWLLLLENGIFVSVVNSLRMKRFCSQSIRKGVKTDRIDAMQIALYGLAYWQELQPTKLPEDTYRELQLLARQYYQMTSMLIKAKADFNAICDQVLPGMQELMNDHAGRSSFRTLSCGIITPHSSSKWEKRAFGRLLQMGRKKKGYRNCERMAAHIFATAQNGIPVLPNAIHADRHYGSDTSPPTQWRRPVTLFRLV